MPTPVTVARQCLTPEAAHALDEAVAVARRRGHGQTTSLHAVSALLSLSSSTLREACARARNSAYSPRLQFKALELCLSVSLDRVPSTQLADDPPVSNSLMAAVKRSQANQRRQPENYHLYHQLSQQSSISAVKVELQQLILSILDDPVVSRVFAEAGFRSSEIKLAILRPFPQLLRYSRSRAHHPLFLCNLTEYPDQVRRTRPSFPFSGSLTDGDENSRRIGQVLIRNRGRNPLLVGVYAYDALQSFVEALEKRKDGVLPVELSGLSVVSTEKDFSKFITEDCDKGSVNLKFGEMGQLVEQSLGPGLLVNIGDLKAFVADNALGDSVSYVVAQLTRLLQLHRGKVWLTGATASYGSYLKFIGRFPSIEKDWDLQLLPITSLRPPLSESYPRSSLMESFVPFGGFFSAPSDLNLPISSSYQCVPRNHLCNEKCGQEAYASPKGAVAASVAGQHQASLPSWLQMAPLGTNKGFDMKTKDDGVLLSAKVTGLQDKWGDTCQHLHHPHPLPEANLFPTIVGFQSPEDKKDNQGNNTNISSNKTECKNTNSCMPIDVQTKSSVPPQATNDSFSSEAWEKPSKDEDLESGGLRSPSLSNSSVVDGSRTSATSTTSVTTDLGLGICSSPASNTANKPPNQNQGLKQDISGCFSPNVDLVNGNLYSVQSSSCSSLDNHGQFDPSDVNVLFRALFERVGWQIEAISVISQRIAHCRSRSENFVGASHRRDIWFNFTGPDRYGKKKTAIALAEVLYGGQEQLICVDLDSQDGMIHSDTIFDCQAVNGYDVKFRGKTVVDYVAGELCKKPLSIVFLENIDKADVVTRNCLSRASLTGKFSDSHGRQVSTSNAIFVTTSKFSKGCNILTSTNGPSIYSEERILQAKGRSVQITIECSFEDSMAISQNWRASSNTTNEGISNQHLLNKRKLIGVNEPLEQHEVSEMPKRANKTSTRYLDLNLPAEETAAQDTDDGSSENDCPSENSKPWLQEFFEQVGDTVVFKPVDFDALAEKISKEIKNSFHKFVDTECLLEIDSKVMEQLLAAVYLTDRHKVVETWVEQVLSRGFAEVQKRCSSNAITLLKLKTCEGPCLEQPAPKTFLPPSIILE
ncbi:unnamed protein product [Prunus armeniaca]|uniref:Clp R domain-containing protein n=1 Tax=Prunus armeniaca TaxID=36596 RepID=A0A6J5U9J9_PRUAR|nr:unnamed protein product [Prunus armeniaca]